MATRKLWLWIRQDGGDPRVIAVGSQPPGPGAVFELDRTGAEEARALYLLATELCDTTDTALAKLSRDELPARLRRAGEIKAAQLSMRQVDLAAEVTRG